MSRLEQLSRLHAADPADAEVPYMIAQEHAKLGDADAAALWFDRCLALDPAHAYACFHKARALEAATRIDEARAALEHGLRIARAARNDKAASEIAAYLDVL